MALAYQLCNWLNPSLSLPCVTLMLGDQLNRKGESQIFNFSDIDIVPTTSNSLVHLIFSICNYFIIAFKDVRTI